IDVGPGAGAGRHLEQGAGPLADVLEGAVAPAAEEPAGAAADGGDVDVELAVAVEVGDGDTAAGAVEALQAGALGGVLEAELALVEEELNVRGVEGGEQDV